MDTVIFWYALATVMLFLKMVAISVFQGQQRFKFKSYKAPEDARAVGVAPAADELPQVQRAARAWLNDLENIPAFWALGWVYIVVDASPLVGPWLFMIFTGARIVHTWCHINALQPWRALAFFAGLLMLLVMSVMILMAIL
ncbi:MAPEG family protein [Pseudohongiella sp.]|uniref:Microsomal glutathione S-transferase 1 n=1 Tax=marine sediment metagenome TaxID=412755 RepID=A0A0F9Y4Q5_9ZZZZ|nr:MAPEG family protein [Pseudohongiella sp.]HDZ10070.1 MAPEG family protein [Pseudohongiella sp.]HEA63419.1 MAPEG family protein [Pseudohongiella sp.]